MSALADYVVWGDIDRFDASFNRLPGLKAEAVHPRRPPITVLSRWGSLIPGEGLGAFPAFWRPPRRKTSFVMLGVLLGGAARHPAHALHAGGASLLYRALFSRQAAVVEQERPDAAACPSSALN
ncbi:hypothetical protein BN873_p10022 [Candidatus Competibacter denitrificans Run_A_D11]|uniref:Uncharacterized protein n=1 Tax=Candidatus Competibacter denitrificans Run_A_D11 TaxID=1400863 RepID=W6MEG6_9GAMM|nr:hypothetical protein [Candidatus Competibacter denitrificans]CDI04578.1 hypothetical protein BN873_p10022 [Candidatus Competibacter denitrificans Run_A_D11]